MAHGLAGWVVIGVLLCVILGGCSTPTQAPTAIPPTAAPTAARAAMATNAAQQGGIAVQEYDLGPATIEQHQVEGNKRNLPYRIQGIIAVPATKGSHPLIIVAHGSHPACPSKVDGEAEIDTWPCFPAQEQRNDLGWRYLLEALASYGYVAVAPNLNAMHTVAWGTDGSTYERFRAIIDTHLRKLAEAGQGNDPGFGVNLNGMIDVTRTAMVGHSQGGGYAPIYAADRATSPADARGGPLLGLLLVAPAFQTMPPDLSNNPLPAIDLPTGIVLGLCDGDVADLQGFTYYEAAHADPKRAHRVELSVIYGANHNFFNAALQADSGLAAPGAPGCDRPAGRLDASEQQAFLTAYARDFFAEVFDTIQPPAAWQTTQPAPQQLYGIPVLSALGVPAAQRHPLALFTNDVLPSDSANVVVSADAPLTADVCSGQKTACQIGTYAIPSTNLVEQRVIHLSWNTSGGVLRFTIPTNERDLSGFASLQLRIALDPYLAAKTGAQPLHLQFRDTSDREAMVLIPKETYALQPPSAEVRGANGPDQFVRGVVPLGVVRVPLRQLNNIDLTHIASIALVFDDTEKGGLLLADPELLR